MDGVETMLVLRKIKSCENTPIIALTANVASEMRAFFINHGFQDYIPKPIDMRALNAAIVKFIPVEKRVYGADKIINKKALKPDFIAYRADQLNHFYLHFKKKFAYRCHILRSVYNVNGTGYPRLP